MEEPVSAEIVDRQDDKLFIKHPFQLFGWTLLPIALLGYVTIPFVNEVENRWLFLLGYLGYAAVLSFVSIGMILLPDGFRQKTYRYLPVLPIVVLLPLLAISFCLWFESELILELMNYLKYVVYLNGLGLGIIFLIACYGWYSRLSNKISKSVQEYE
ncbi:MAG TPA: hypothetical protein DD473_12745 [Planctomycetaceae bacterium]|nr:hypothetical protein [Planctomycetaceae bacterium]|tara:strand:- start:98 stop:568 length:471 start_codon:yes stop_codon:yes gene_type:complete